MRLRNKLYVHANRTQVGSDWSAYKHVRNKVNNLMKDAYHNYCTHLFDDSHTNNRKRFWLLIKHQRKDFSSITSLEIDGHITSPQEKAETLNNHFFTFFTDENTLFSNLETTFPLIGRLSFSTKGIENVLNNLSTNKSPGPDCIPNFVLNSVAQSLLQYYR